MAFVLNIPGDLQRLRSQLASLSQELPGRFVRFHENHKALEADLERLQGRWWPFIRRTDLNALFSKVQAQFQWGLLLRDLKESSDPIEKGIEEWSRQARSADNQKIVRTWRLNWEARIGLIGKYATLDSEVRQDHETLRAIGSEHQIGVHALGKLEKAQACAPRLSGHPKVLEFERELKQWHDQFLQGPPDADTLKRLEEWLDPWLELGAPPVRPEEANKSAVNDNVDLLQEAVRWAVTGIGADLLDDFRGRNPDAVDISAGPDRIEKYRGELRQLVEKQRKQALGERSSQLRQLEEFELIYCRACGPDPSLKGDLEGLQKGDVSTPHAYQDWKRLQKPVLERFRGKAQARMDELKEAVRNQLDELSATNKRLSTEPLFRDELDEHHGATNGLERIGAPDNPEQVLETVRRLGDLRRDMADLSRKAALNREFLEELQRRLLAKRDRLNEFAALLEHKLCDWEPRSAAEQSLLEFTGSEKEKLAGRLESHLEEHAERLLQRCDQLLREEWVPLEALWRVLTSLPEHVPNPPPAPEPKSGFSDLDQAMLELKRLRTLSREGTAIAEEVQEKLETRRLSLIEELRSIPDSSRAVSSRERDEALRSLSEPGLEATLANGLAAAAAVCSKAERILDRHFGDAKEIKRVQREYREALLRFRDEGLDLLAPQTLVDRVVDLLEGFPESPTLWNSAAQQLYRGFDLLERLEEHARRQAALHLTEAAKTLRRAQREDREALDLLARLEALRDTSNPDRVLFRQVTEAARRIQRSAGRHRN